MSGSHIFNFSSWHPSNLDTDTHPSPSMENGRELSTSYPRDSNESTPCCLLKLPPEMRNNIYAAVFAKPEPNGSDLPIPLESAKPPSSALSLTCRQVYRETRVLYREALGSFWSKSKFLIDLREPLYQQPSLPQLRGLSNSALEQIGAIDVLVPHEEDVVMEATLKKIEAKWWFLMANLPAQMTPHSAVRWAWLTGTTVPVLEKHLRQKVKAMALETCGVDGVITKPVTPRANFFYSLALWRQLGMADRSEDEG